jgi:hypothetical protein
MNNACNASLMQAYDTELSTRITLRFIQATHSPLATLPLPLILCATDAWPFPIRLLQLLA